MSPSPDLHPELAQFPAALRSLISAELAAGNAIAELGHGFPAAPCGAYVKLAHPVRSRPREKAADLSFFDRNNSSYSGEFTDASRHFFVLEPPHAPEPPPDTNAIRSKLNSEYDAANRADSGTTASSPDDRRSEIARSLGAAAHSLVNRFVASMSIDYEKWREGIGYDLELLRHATPSELAEIEELLLRRRHDDWRDIEALAALGSDRTKRAIIRAHETGGPAARMAVHRYAPELLSDEQRSDALARTLEQADFFGGLSQALEEVARFHPPEIVDTLLRGITQRDGAAACHFAAMLYFIHGKSSCAFDWDHRPFFLRFNTEDPAARETAARELFAALDIEPSRYLASKRT